MKLKDLEKRLKQEPENLGLKVTVAGLMREAGRSTEAVELYRSVALAYRDQGRKQQAIMVCRSILEIAPDDARCIALLSQLTLPEPSASLAAASAPAPHSSVPSIPRTQTSPPRTAVPTPTPHPSVPSIPRTQTSPPRTPSSPGRKPSTPTTPTTPLTPPRTPSSPGRTPSQPPGRTPSQPPRSPTLPPRKVTIPPRATTDAGTPPPMSSRMASEAPPPPAAAARLPLEPPARRSSGKTNSPDGPQRRSSMEETPLPKPVPHHLYDRTSKATLPDLEEQDTNPDGQRPRTPTGGLAEAARKITGLINRDDDVAQPMDTRPVRRIRDEDLRKLGMAPPPTGEHARLSDEDIDTRPQEALTKPGSDDEELTTPRDLLDPDD